MAANSGQGVACQSCGGQLVLGNLFCDSCRQMWGAPEGVKSADYGTRAAAYIIDMVITWGLSIAVIVLGIVFAISFNNFWTAIIPLIVIWLGYIVWWVMLLRKSQTPGKLIMKLWVVRDSAPARRLGTDAGTRAAGQGTAVRPYRRRNVLHHDTGRPAVAAVGPQQADAARQDHRDARCARSEAGFV